MPETPPQASLFDAVPGYARKDASDTSQAAATSVARTGPTMRLAVLAYVESRGPRGATCDEIEVALHMRHQTASARVRELVELGKLTPTAARRNTRSGRKATVYVSAC